jgi:citrate synthase
VAAYAGTMRSSLNLGLGAAIAVSEAKVYGHQVNVETVDFLFKVKDIVDDGRDFGDYVKEILKTRRRIGGYGRPLINSDERISPLLELATKLGLENGPFVKMVFEIESFLLKNRYRMRMNVSALTTALLADQGLDKNQIYYFRSLMFTAGIIPCYIDSLNKPAKSFFPLRCSRIHYEGTAARRQWSASK